MPNGNRSLGPQDISREDPINFQIINGPNKFLQTTRDVGPSNSLVGMDPSNGITECGLVLLEQKRRRIMDEAETEEQGQLATGMEIEHLCPKNLLEAGPGSQARLSQ